MLGTTQIPVSRLLSVLSRGQCIIGLSVTPLTHEVACLVPPYTAVPHLLSSGNLLSPQDLKEIVDKQHAGALILGGTALYKADGSTHFGVRKLISCVSGLSYDQGDWLPRKMHHVTDSGRTNQLPNPVTTILLCREAEDNAVVMLSNYIQRHVGHLLSQSGPLQNHSSFQHLYQDQQHSHLQQPQ